MRTFKMKDQVMNLHVKKYPHMVKAVPEHYGYYLVMAEERYHTEFDFIECGVWCNPGLTVVSAAKNGKLNVVKPWRCKKNGKEYGSEWVSLQDEFGDRRYYRLEKLGAHLFGEAWAETKRNISFKASQKRSD